MSKSHTIQDVKKYAKSKSGKCLSKKYINAHTKLKWECSEGHIWNADFSHIKRGQWCPYCSGRRKTIKNMQKIAEERNGECLSKKYINNKTKLKWKCEHGHVWEAIPHNINRGAWCPYCVGNKKKNIKDMQKLAKNNNGKCLSDKYVNDGTKLKWECSEGHIWEAVPNSIKRGVWCPYCAKVASKTIEDAHKLAQKNNGKFLSDVYLNCSVKYKWQCEFGHIWKATYSSINSGQWCPYCAGQIVTLKDMQKLAQERDGKFLSKKYINANTKLEWQCSEGHVWNATPSNIQQGKWCPYCVGRYQTIQDMQKLAKKKKGKCLSGKYIDAHTKLRWQCEKGHIWKATPSQIKNCNLWCPYCRTKSEQKFRESIEKILCAKFPRKYPKWLVNENGNRLELDGYNRILKIAFEYQGYQHFFTLHNNFFGGEKALTKRQKHDRIKKEMCEKRGIILLCPTYEMDESQYEDFIKKEIKKLQ